MFVLTSATKVAIDLSVEQPPTNLAYVIKSTNTYIKTMFYHILLITNMFPMILRSSLW